MSNNTVGLYERRTNAANMSRLFGAGGHHDGVTALINTTENDRIEEDMAVSGMGERVIDENIIPNNVANLNSEFNFHTMKTGAARQPDGAVAKSQAYQRLEDGLSAGDTNISTQQGDHTKGQVIGALQEVFGQYYHADEPESQLVGAGNPFAGFENINRVDPFGGVVILNNKSSGQDANMEGEGFVQTNYRSTAEAMHSDNHTVGADTQVAKQSLDFYMNDDSHADIHSVPETLLNHDTGLRRRNIRSSQSTQLQRVAKTSDIMRAVEDSVSTQAEIMKNQVREAFRSTDERNALFDQLHTDTNKLTASQVGVNDISENTYKHHSSRKGMNRGEHMRNVIVGA